MRMVHKINCTYDRGYIIENNEIVALPQDVAMLLRKLEGLLQRAEYIAKQGPYHPAPSLDGFERKTEAIQYYKTQPVETPHLDAAVEESLKIAADIRRSSEQDELEEFLKGFNPLFEFCEYDSFVEGHTLLRLDLPTVGDPLELTGEELMDYLTDIFGIISGLTGDIDGDC